MVLSRLLRNLKKLKLIRIIGIKEHSRAQIPCLFLSLLSNLLSLQKDTKHGNKSTTKYACFNGTEQQYISKLYQLWN